MATEDGPLRLRVISGAIEERGGQVLATLNEGATPSMLQSFVNFIDDLAEFGCTDDVIETLFPDDYVKRTDQETKVKPEKSLQEQADDDYDALLSYESIKAVINQETRMMMIPTPLVLKLLREHFELPLQPGESGYNTAARDEYEYRRAHEDGLINMDYDD